MVVCESAKPRGTSTRRATDPRVSRGNVSGFPCSRVCLDEVLKSGKVDRKTARFSAPFLSLNDNIEFTIGAIAASTASVLASSIFLSEEITIIAVMVVLHYALRQQQDMDLNISKANTTASKFFFGSVV
ncbi:hypothetical protein Tco_0899244 [Tanacetum coccineum]